MKNVNTLYKPLNLVIKTMLCLFLFSISTAHSKLVTVRVKSKIQKTVYLKNTNKTDTRYFSWLRGFGSCTWNQKKYYWYPYCQKILKRKYNVTGQASCVKVPKGDSSGRAGDYVLKIDCKAEIVKYEKRNLKSHHECSKYPGYFGAKFRGGDWDCIDSRSGSESFPYGGLSGSSY